jgi:hypothetical protein
MAPRRWEGAVSFEKLTQVEREKIRDELGVRRAPATVSQPKDSGLTDIAALAVTDGNVIVGNGTNWVAESGATARTSLGLGTGNSPTFTGLNLTAPVAITSNDPVITMTDTDTGAINRFSANNDTGSLRLYADLGNTVADSRFYLNVDGADQLELSSTVAAFAVDVSVPDEAYDATAWNASLEVPTKNAVRDFIETLPATYHAAMTQQGAIADPAGGATTDTEARAAIASILTALRTLGLIAT